MGLSFYGQINPDATVPKTTRKGLGEIDFPVVFKICMNPSFNDTELHSVGYDNMYFYFMGKSRFNSSNYGWSGHTEDGGVVSNASDIQDRIFLNYTSAIHLTQLYVGGNWTFIPTSSYKLLKPNYPNNCLTLDISMFLKVGDQLDSQLVIIFDRSAMFVAKLEVNIDDRLQTMSRYYMASKLKTQGSIIYINDKEMEEGLTKTYMLTFTQDIFVEEDKDHNCVVYPTVEYDTFEDCDSQYLDDLLQQDSLYPAWATPPVWATPEDLSIVTNLNKNSSGLSPAIQGYFMGVTPSPCQNPCTQTAITSIYSDTQMTKWDGVAYPSIGIKFNPYVEVTTHYFPKFQFLAVFQDLGSSLGLWLGVGAIQALEPLARFLFAGAQRKG